MKVFVSRNALMNSTSFTLQAVFLQNETACKVYVVDISYTNRLISLALSCSWAVNANDNCYCILQEISKELVNHKAYKAVGY